MPTAAYERRSFQSGAGAGDCTRWIASRDGGLLVTFWMIAGADANTRWVCPSRMDPLAQKPTHPRIRVYAGLAQDIVSIQPV